MSVFDVAIIGAGAAGIAAARRLGAAGKRIIMLEARDRAGGRAAVDESLGAPADLGAAWLHFARINAWTPLAEAGGFTVLKRDPGLGRGGIHRRSRAPRRRNAKRPAPATCVTTRSLPRRPKRVAMSPYPRSFRATAIVRASTPS